MSSVVKKKLKINGMHCTACAMNIDFDLEDIDGVKKSQTSYAKAVTEVEFEEEKVDTKTILETVKKTGYEAVLLSD